MSLHDTKHTARYQLSRFLQSNESLKLPIDFKDVAILVTIFDFMDSGDKEECFADQLLISKISRVPRSTLIERIKKYQKLNLLKKVRVGYKNYYYIGETIKKYVQSLDLVSPTTGHSKSSSRTLYKNNYKNINNDNRLKNAQEVIKKAMTERSDVVSPLLEEFMKH
jgi:hypothetical protein